MQTIQTKLATDASAIESRVIRAMSLPLRCSINVLLFMLCSFSTVKLFRVGGAKKLRQDPVVESERAQLVDARGHRCPTPTLRLRRALDAVKGGETVTILADDPLARIDIPHFAGAHGHTIESLIVEGTSIRVVVRKAAGP